jgi:hypothetical protein
LAAGLTLNYLKVKTPLKRIDTLVADIYKLFQSPVDLPADLVKSFGDKLSSIIAERLKEAPGKKSLRMSNLGTKCERRLWYQINRPERAEPLHPAARVKFLFGDIIEQLVLFLARAAGHVVEDEQKEVELYGIKGHIDGKVDGVLVDVKSASSRSFTKFENGLTEEADDFGYLRQLDAYLHATNGEEGAFLVIDKQLGKLKLDKHKRRNENYEEIVSKRLAMLGRKEPPPRAYRAEADGKSGNLKLGTACSYCEFKHHCWPGLRTFLYANGPRFLTEVRRIPDVPEITGKLDTDETVD